MASPYIFPAGFGGLTGGAWATAKPLCTTGTAYYVYSVTGSDAYAGTDRAKPFATLGAAITAAAANDTIVILSGHAETLAAALTMNKANLWIQGEGSGASMPRFTANGAIAMFDITAAGVRVDTIFFPASLAAPTARIQSASTETVVSGCWFECGIADTGPAVKFVTGAGQGTVENSTFESTSTAIATQPAIGIEVANAMTDLNLANVLFDGGSVGWSDYAFKGTAAITRLDASSIALLRGSDFYAATGSVYRVNVSAQTGSSKVVLTA